MTSDDEKPTSSNSDTVHNAQGDAGNQEKSDGIALPSHVAGSGSLDRLIDTARDYARAAASDNTLTAYAKDWAHFTRWCRMKGTEPLPPSPEMIGLYLADLASGSAPSPCMFSLPPNLNRLVVAQMGWPSHLGARFGSSSPWLSEPQGSLTGSIHGKLI